MFGALEGQAGRVTRRTSNLPSGSLSGRLVLPVIGAAIALTVAACGSDGSSAAPPGSAAATTPASAAPTTSAPAPTTAPPTHASAAVSPAVSRCHTSQLTASFGNQGGAAGTILGFIRLSNTGGVTCTLYGYIGMGLLDANKNALQSTIVRGGGMGTEKTLPKTLVTLARGQVAHVEYSFSDVPSGTATSCPNSTYVQITPPDETDYLLVTQHLAPCQGQIGIGAVQPGDIPASG
jgi:hypothetical protein